jgi:hypothetical protein
MYTLPNNPKKITGYAFVAQNPAVKLAVITGSAQEAYARKVGVICCEWTPFGHWRALSE